MPFDYSLSYECSDYGLDAVPLCGCRSGVDVNRGEPGDYRCVFRYQLAAAKVELVVLDVKRIHTAVDGSDCVD